MGILRTMGTGSGLHPSTFRHSSDGMAKPEVRAYVARTGSWPGRARPWHQASGTIDSGAMAWQTAQDLPAPAVRPRDVDEARAAPALCSNARSCIARAASRSSMQTCWALLCPLAVMYLSGCHTVPRDARSHYAGSPVDPILSVDRSDPLEVLAFEQPLDFLRFCRKRCADTITDYRCRYQSQERRGDVLKPEQEMQVLYRANPVSVDMRWIRNAGIAKRVNYVAGRWVEDGQNLFFIELTGVLGLIAPNGVRRDIHSPEAKRAARGSIDQFGFKNTLDRIIETSDAAKDDPQYDMRYIGRSEFGGRPTYYFERRLPFAQTADVYPERLLQLHIDREWLVPTACIGYADEERKKLVGSYTMTDVEMNVGLGDDDFKP